MAEEYENYGARAAEALRTVERWDADGEAQDSESPAVLQPLEVRSDEEQHVPLDDERTRNLAEFRRQSGRRQQLTWCTSAKEQDERTALDATIRMLHTLLFPSTRDAWHEDWLVSMHPSASRA